MKFNIINGLPYLVANGKIFAVAIEKTANGYSVEYDKKSGKKSKDAVPRYSLPEIVAKCSKLSSISKKAE